MTWLGAVGVLLSLIALPWAFIERSGRRLGLFFMMLGAHVATSVIFYYYVQTHDADTALYYFDSNGFLQDGAALGGTYTLLLIVQTMKATIGGSYLDYFLIFQTIGFLGIALLARTIEEICADLNTAQPVMLFAVLFLPGIYFWTSAIYKDPPLFLASALAGWATLQIQRRWLAFGVAVVLMALFRQHVAFLAVLALLGSVLFDRNTNVGVRVLIWALASAGLAAIVLSVRATMGLDLIDTSAVDQFLQSQNEIVSGLGSEASGESLANAAIWFKVISLLFRPFFFDVQDFFGMVASFENILLAYIFAVLVIRWRLVAELFVKLAFFRYAVLFTVFMIALLSILYYNVGLGLRQRTMYMATLMIVFACVRQVSDIRRGAVVPGAAPTPNWGAQTPRRALNTRA